VKARIITSHEELSDYEDDWERLRRQCNGSIYSSNFLIRAWFEAFSSSASPRVILVEDNSELVGIAPLCSYRYMAKGLPLKVVSLAGDVRGKLRLTNNTILCPSDRQDVLEAIIEQLKRMRWSFLWTINMERSPTVENYLNMIRSTWNTVECDVNKGLLIPLPPSGELSDAYESNPRHNYRKIVNRLEREGVDTRLERLTKEDIDRAVDVYAQQHIERWASKGGSYFRDPENVKFLKRSMMEGFDRRYSFAYQLRMNGEVAAQVFGFTEGKKAYAKRIGMDDRFSRYSPGWLLCNRFLTELRDQGVGECDMGWGRERYKYEMGGQELQLVGIGATRGFATAAARVALGSGERGLESVLESVGGNAGPGHGQVRTVGN
jgi:hypothetical protein